MLTAQEQWAVGIVEDCLREAGDDVDAGYAAAEYIIATQPMPDLSIALAMRCPSGYTKEKPLTLQGREYIGGEYIPGYVKIPEHVKKEIDEEKKNGPKKKVESPDTDEKKPDDNKTELPNTSQETDEPDDQNVATEPTTDAAKAEQEAKSDKSNTPRDVAEKVAKVLDKDYEFARLSAIPNVGVDLKGSARHKRNAWRGLADAEADGTAEQLVTRAMLLKNEPLELMSKVTVSNGANALAAHLTMMKFPAKPDTERQTAEQAKKTRADYLEVYRKLKSVAEESVDTPGKKDYTPGVLAMEKIREAVIAEITRLRKEDRYSKVANSLIPMYKATDLSWKKPKNGVASQLADFNGRLLQAYDNIGKDVDGKGTYKSQAEHVKDIMEGDSFNKTFGTMEEGTKRVFDPAEMYVKTATRKGGRDVNAATVTSGTDFVMNELKMKGLQWGNSVTDDEREHHLQKSAEAFADLADVVGLPDSAMSLDGVLGLAIGARGKGNASAHYEPDTKVINLTRKNGVGTIAHEWGHALDHYLTGGQIKDNAGDYMSNNTSAKRVERDAQGNYQRIDMSDDPIWLKMADVRVAMQESGFNSRLKTALSQGVQLGIISKEKAMHYWNSGHEKFARTFEQHVRRKLENDGRENTYLSGFVKDTENMRPEAKLFYSLWPTKEESEKIAPAIDELMKAVKKKHFAKEPEASLSAFFAHDIANRRAQGVLSKAMQSAKGLTRDAKKDLATALKRGAKDSGAAIMDFIAKYRLQLAKLLNATQLASLLEGAREVATDVPTLAIFPGAVAPPPTLEPKDAVALVERLEKLTDVARAEAIYALPADQQVYAQQALAAKEAGGLPPPKFAPPAPPSGSPEGIHFPTIDEAVKQLAEKNVMTRERFDALDTAARAKSFAVASVDADDTLTKIRDVLAENVRTGADYETFKEKVLEAVDEGTFMSEAHLETVFRTNVQSAFSDGQMTVLSNPMVRSGFPYSAYDSIHDDRVRHEHLELDKLGIGGTNVYRNDDPVFQTFRPPWDYNCRCSWTPMTVRQASEAGIEEARTWIDTGVEPSPPAFVQMPDFAPPPGFQRAVSSMPLSIQLSLQSLAVFSRDSSGHEHKGEGEGGGQFTGTGQGGAKKESTVGKGVNAVKKANQWLHDMGHAGFAKLPTAVQSAISTVVSVAFAGWTASQNIAERISVEKGNTPEQAAQTRSILAAADLVAFKPMAIATAPLGGAVAAATWVVPPVTACYLAHSAVLHPLATYRAARGVIRDIVKGVKG